jgi:hypothetical protein
LGFLNVKEIGIFHQPGGIKASGTEARGFQSREDIARGSFPSDTSNLPFIDNCFFEFLNNLFFLKYTQ